MAHPDVQDEQRLTAKGRATRDRIVQAAAQLIVTEGLSASNMERVRKAASVSGSQLAHYFTDKSALIRAVVRHQIGVVLDFHRQPKLGDLDSFDDFERWIDLNMRYLRRIGTSGRTPTYHALTAQLAKSDDATRATLAAGYWQWIELLEAGDPADERPRRSGRRCRPATVGDGHRQRPPGRRHIGLHLSGGMAARRRHSIRGQLSADVRYRPRRTSPAPGRGVPAAGARTAKPLIPLSEDSNVSEDPRFTRKGLATRARIVDAAARSCSSAASPTPASTRCAARPGWADPRSRTTSATSAI